MHQIVRDVSSAQRHKTRQPFRRTALSLFVGGSVLYSAGASAEISCYKNTSPVDPCKTSTQYIRAAESLTKPTSTSNSYIIVDNETDTTLGRRGVAGASFDWLVSSNQFLPVSNITVTNNKAEIKESTINTLGGVYGAFLATYGSYSVTFSGKNSVSDNTVSISGSDLAIGTTSAGTNAAVQGNKIAGASSFIGAKHILNDKYSVSGNNNTVTITNSVIRPNSTNGGILGIYGLVGYLEAQIKGEMTFGGNGNGITIDNSNINTSVYGSKGQIVTAQLQPNGKITLNSTNSFIDIKNGSTVTGDVIGDNGIINDIGETNTLKVDFSNAQINIDNSTVNGNVYGGKFDAVGNVYYNSVVESSGAIININSSKLNNSDVFGTYLNITKVGGGNGSVFKGINNTINLTGDLSDSGFNSLFGAKIDGEITGLDLSYDVFTGNTLNMSSSPVVVNQLGNFETYNFTLDPSMRNQLDFALITAETVTLGTNDTNISGGEQKKSEINVLGIKAGKELLADDKFALIRATDTLSGEAQTGTFYGVAQQGISLLYDVETAVEGNLVTATILGNNKPVDPEKPVDPGKPAAKVNPQLKALSEGHLASAMMLTRSADTLAYNTVHTIQHQNPDKGLAPFIILSGGKNRYNSGSDINAKDGQLTGGLSYLTDNLVSAVIIESGWGSYDTHNDFNGMKDVNGDGHNRYVGAAILGHYDFDSGVFAEASLRAGKNRNTFDTKDIINLSTGEYARYNLDSNYLGAHIGTGYSKTLDEKNTADVSAKYLWTQLKGKNVNVADDSIHFDDINSHRVRIEAGLSHQYTETVALRAGLGYEYEFDGKAKATTYGYDIAAPGVQGSTGILTLGSTVTPLATQPLSVDINLNGYTGKRDGVGGSIKFSYAF